mmetsp:Transcript_77779/g.214974  ORF Transcript_77779/g.214974 Transcript_77779/m.214974 type:complete len:202 (-) Transcript_77779:83-688(-)
MPALMRTSRAVTKYSKFTAASGSFVCKRRNFGGSLPSSAKQYMDSGVAPRGRVTRRSRRKSSLRGTMACGRQPMLYSTRSRAFFRLSSLSRALSSACESSNSILALHSPCRRPSPSGLAYHVAPRGSRHSWQRVTCSPSESSSASKSSGFGSVSASWPTTVKSAFSAWGARPVKQQDAGLPRHFGWNQSCGALSSRSLDFT